MAREVLEKAEVEVSDARSVYNGEYVQQAAAPAARSNRPVRRHKRSPVTLIFVVMLVSLVTVLYIWNKITVIRLAEEVNDLQVQYQKILNANEILRAEINQKSKLERIGKIATDQLGLTYPKEQPNWLNVEVDPSGEFRKE